MNQSEFVGLFDGFKNDLADKITNSDTLKDALKEKAEEIKEAAQSAAQDQVKSSIANKFEELKPLMITGMVLGFGLALAVIVSMKRE